MGSLIEHAQCAYYYHELEQSSKMAYLDGVVRTVAPCRSAWMGDILIQNPHDISQFEYF